MHLVSSASKHEVPMSRLKVTLVKAMIHRKLNTVKTLNVTDKRLLQKTRHEYLNAWIKVSVYNIYSSQRPKFPTRFHQIQINYVDKLEQNELIIYLKFKQRGIAKVSLNVECLVSLSAVGSRVAMYRRIASSMLVEANELDAGVRAAGFTWR